MSCIPCARERSKLPWLIGQAKERAKEDRKYYAVVYDKEDKRYCITTEELAKEEGLEIVDLLSPY